MPILAEKPTTPDTEKLTRAEWKSIKKGLPDSKNDIGPKIEAVEKAYKKINWNEFPLDTDSKNWRENAEKIGKTRATYIVPVIDALDTLDAALAAEAKLAKDTGGRARMEALQKKSDRLRDTISRFYVELKDACRKELAARGGGGTQTLNWSKDLAKEVAQYRKERNDACFQYRGPAPVSVEFTIADFGGKENPFITARIYDAINECFEEAAETIAAALDEACKKLKNNDTENPMALLKKLKAGTDAEIAAVNRDITKKIQTAADAEYTDYCQKKQEYKVYKLKMAGKAALGTTAVVGSTIGTIGAAATLAAAPFTAGTNVPVSIAALVLSAKSALSSSIKLGKLIADIAASAEDIGGSVQYDLKKLVAEFKKKPEASSYWDAAKTAGNAAVSFFIGESFFTTIDKVSSDCTLWNNKTKGLLVAAAGAAKPIIKLMEAAEKAGKDITEKIKNLDDQKNKIAAITDTKKQKEAEKALKKHEEKLKKAKTSLTKLEKQLQDVIDNVEKTAFRFNENIKSVTQCGRKIEELAKIRSQNVPRAVDAAISISSAVLSVAEIAGGLALTGVSGVSGVTDALLAVNDGLGALQGICETVYDLASDLKG